jgi:mRNA interferase MazF
MKKDFKAWHRLKSDIHYNRTPPHFRELEIWWCSMGSNIGFEEDGKNQLFERPVLVYRKFNKELFWGVPLTSKERTGRFYYSFPLFNKKRTIVFSQLRILSGKRLIRRIGKISDKQFQLIEKALLYFINETDPLRGPRVPNGNNS